MCRSCFATIGMVEMESGKKMPVDLPATPRTGNVAARRVGTRWVAGYVLSKRQPDVRPGFTLFTAHWTHCDMGKPAKPVGPPTRRPLPNTLF